MDRLYQQALAETGAGVGLVVPKISTVGLSILAVDNAQRDMAAVGNAGGTATAYRFGEDTVQRRDCCRRGGNRAAG
ncbi:hypothetical protein D3C87_1970170 [compost metagenome]